MPEEPGPLVMPIVVEPYILRADRKCKYASYSIIMMFTGLGYSDSLQYNICRGPKSSLGVQSGNAIVFRSTSVFSNLSICVK